MTILALLKSFAHHEMFCNLDVPLYKTLAAREILIATRIAIRYLIAPSVTALGTIHYPPPGGYYVFSCAVCPSVCPSVRLSRFTPLTLWTPLLPFWVVGLRPDLIHMKAKTLNLGLVKVTCRSRQKRAFGATSKLTKNKISPIGSTWAS